MKLENNNSKFTILGRTLVFVLCLILSITSCSKDDETEPPTPPRDRTVQQLADKDSLIKYLENHYYNSTDFESSTNPTISELIITKLNDGESVPVGNTLLMDSPLLSVNIITYADTEYEFYVLKLNQGGGDDKPTFADDVRVLYEASLLNGTVVDKNDQIPTYFDLITDVAVEGWRRVLPLFNTAESFGENGDGTISFFNKGMGIMFLPSGLGYYANAQSNVPAYSPLIFKFELLQMFENDHDGDGIPSYLEDLNNDGEFTVNFENNKDETDDDTDGDFSANYNDLDDDGDGILTRNEITIATHNKPTRAEVLAMPLLPNQVLLNQIIKEQNGSYTGKVITFPDTDNDGIPDYLDR